mgnify:CR=1 FL=1
MPSSISFGLTLPNRGVSFGASTLKELIDLAIEAEQCGKFQSIWIGDNLMARRRPESIVFLTALASRTTRVRLGIGCMASFPVRNPVALASQWATLDAIAGPDRVILAACTGGRRGGGDWRMEERAFGIPEALRIQRLEEGMQVLRLLWTQPKASFQGKYIAFEDVTAEPLPVTKPYPPVWLAVNPRPFGGDGRTIRGAVRRTARLSDGWMVSRILPTDFSALWEEILEERMKAGLASDSFDNCLYYNANIDENEGRAHTESKRFLDEYYNMDWPDESVQLEVAYGSEGRVQEKIHRYAEAGVKEITFRLTSYDQRTQFDRLVKVISGLD